MFNMKNFFLRIELKLYSIFIIAKISLYFSFFNSSYNWLIISVSVSKKFDKVSSLAPFKYILKVLSFCLNLLE